MIENIQKWWSSLSSRERLLVSAGTGVVILSLLFVFLVDPMLERLDLAGRQIAKKQRALSTLAGIATEYKEASSRLAAIEGRMGGGKEGFSLLSFLEETSRLIQVRDRIASMRPQSIPAGGRYKETAVEARFEGIYWQQLLSLLAAVEGAPHLIKVTRFQVKPRYDTPHLLDATLLVSSYDRSNERGIALVLVLLVLTLLAAVILQFDTEARLELREAANFRDSFKAVTLARAGVHASRAVLQHDQQMDLQAGLIFDALTEMWAAPITDYPLGDGILSAVIEDERGKLNVNDLSYQPDPIARRAKIAQFKRLFELVGVDPRLVDAMADWVDADDLSDGSGVESAYYLSLTPPYRPANGPLQTLGDLRLIKGFSDALVRRLSRYLTVYPISPDGWINVNTADPLVIRALHPQITTVLANELVQGRPFRTIQDIDRVGNMEPIAKELRLLSAYGVRSDHFSARITASVNGMTKEAYAVIRRPMKPGTDSVLYLRVE